MPAAPESPAASPIALTPTRIVPGAPPPAPLTKSQLKKRKKVNAAKSKEDGASALDIVESPRDAALVDHVPSVITDALVADAEQLNSGVEPQAASATGEKAPSALVDQVINKRLKHVTKKIQRIQVYAAKPEKELNEDQKVALQTLPQLEAVVKELEEIKKLTEAHEADEAAKLAEERAATAKLVENKIKEAVEYAQAQHVTHTRSLVAFLALSTLLAAPFPVSGNDLGDHRLPSDEQEKTAVVDAGKLLLTPEFGNTEKDDLIKALLGNLHDGSFANIPYDRLRQIAAQFIHPPTPIPSAPASPTLHATTNGHPPTNGVHHPPEPAPTPAVQASSAIGAGFLAMPSTGSFQFMSASDLDLDPSNDITEQDPVAAPTSEWVHVEQPAPPSFGVNPNEVAQESAVMSEEVEKLAAEEAQDIQAQSPAVPIAPTAVTTEAIRTTLDWATADDDDAELPSVDSLEQHFGKSGTQTPLTPVGASAATPPVAAEAAPAPAAHQTNGHAEHSNDGWHTRGGHRGGRGGGRHGWSAPANEPDADGFVSASRRGRGGQGGRGYDRGGRGGGFRGDGHRGSYRGRGGPPGGNPREQDGAASPSGGDEFRGRGRGNRGGYRGYSEEGGRGGRGRGGYRGRGNGQQSPAPIETS
ncbi:hypothetical protein DL93DRAFT_813957 [Clavulina sp. PMI_390]|nr:hypothetical protein DL93DRAFT_813957 [Clavulina sp. PMI_390]